MSKIINEARLLYYDFMMYDDKLGDVFVKNEKALERDQLSIREEQLLKRYLALLMKTNIISKTTKSFIRSGVGLLKSDRATFEQIIRKQEEKKEEKYNMNTCLSMLRYDSIKLQGYFEEDMVSDIKDKFADLDKCEVQLNKAVARYSKPTYLNEKLAIELPVAEFYSNLTDEEFENMKSIIKPYTKKAIDQMISMMPVEYVGYLQYLFSVEAEELNEVDKSRKNKMQEMFRNGYTLSEMTELKKKMRAKENSIDKEEVHVPKQQAPRQVIRPEKTNSQASKEGMMKKYNLETTRVQF